MKKKKALAGAIKWAAITFASLTLFIICKDFAARERGYTAIGGEYLLLLLPFIYYIFERVVKEFTADIKQLYKEATEE